MKEICSFSNYETSSDFCQRKISAEKRSHFLSPLFLFRYTWNRSRNLIKSHPLLLKPKLFAHLRKVSPEAPPLVGFKSRNFAEKNPFFTRQFEVSQTTKILQISGMRTSLLKNDLFFWLCCSCFGIPEIAPKVWSKTTHSSWNKTFLLTSEKPLLRSPLWLGSNREILQKIRRFSQDNLKVPKLRKFSRFLA